MRDPDRIARILAILRTIWEKNPDLRLGQILANSGAADNLFYIEDSKLEGELVAFMRRVG